MKNNVTKNLKAVRKSRLAAKCKATLMTMILTLAALMNTGMIAFAEGEGTPSGVDTTTMDTLITIVFWVIRIMVLAPAIPSIQKISDGQSNEDARTRNSGIIGLIVSGACFAATFAIEALF